MLRHIILVSPIFLFVCRGRGFFYFGVCHLDIILCCTVFGQCYRPTLQIVGVKFANLRLPVCSICFSTINEILQNMFWQLCSIWSWSRSLPSNVIYHLLPVLTSFTMCCPENYLIRPALFRSASSSFLRLLAFCESLSRSASILPCVMWGASITLPLKRVLWIPLSCTVTGSGFMDII